MKYYRVVYNQNRIASCTETNERIVGNEPYYEQKDGQLDFAIIRADNESQARSVAKYLAIEMMQKFNQHNAA